MESGYDLGCADRVLIDEVSVPRLAGIPQGGVNVLFASLTQVAHFRVGDGIWEVTHILLQGSVHQLKAADQKFHMVAGRRDVKPLIGAPSWINDEVGKGFVEEPNRLVGVLEEKERVDR